MPATRPRRRTTRLLLAAPALALLLGAGACSAGEASVSPDAPSEGSPDAPSEGSAAAAPSDADFETATRAWELELAQCFRDEGLDIKDPKPGEALGDGGGDPAFLETYPTCSAKIGDPPVKGVDPADAPENLKTDLVVVGCLRDKGYQMEDPVLGGSLLLPEDASNEDIEACDKEAGV